MQPHTQSEAKDATLNCRLWYSGPRFHANPDYQGPAQFQRQAEIRQLPLAAITRGFNRTRTKVKNRHACKRKVRSASNLHTRLTKTLGTHERPVLYFTSSTFVTLFPTNVTFFGLPWSSNITMRFPVESPCGSLT